MLPAEGKRHQYASNRKFKRRFAAIEAALAARGKAPKDSTLAEMDSLWNEAKAKERRR